METSRRDRQDFWEESSVMSSSSCCWSWSVEVEKSLADGSLETTTPAAAAADDDDDDVKTPDKWVRLGLKRKLWDNRWELAKEKKINRVRDVRIPPNKKSL